MVIRLLQSEDRFPEMTIAEADDGEDVVRMVREKMGKGEKFDFILMDNIMVLYVAPNIYSVKLLFTCCLLCFALLTTSQLKMHGPQAARILRNELNFQGVIIGDALVPESRG
jgi:hypothetical protein